MTVSLNGTNTEFDTILSAYQKTIQGGVSKLTIIGCNDDAWNDISMLTSLSLKANQTYIFVSFTTSKLILQSTLRNAIIL